MKAIFAAVLQDAVGRSVTVDALEPCSGGCINNAVRIVSSAGDFFGKWNDACAPDLFTCEAAGLRALREAVAAAGAAQDLMVPEVLDARQPADSSPALIVMEYLAPAPRSADAACDAQLGRGLAHIHRRTADSFGMDSGAYCGSAPLDNSPCTDWIEFYRDRRLAPILGLIDQHRPLPTRQRSDLQQLVQRLPQLLAHAPPPALIHGDLWAGNYLATTRGPAIVDPSVCYCDRELEFGITTLFGGFGPRFWAAYDEAYPLPAEWRERNPLYQLFHLLNHHYLFGGSYGASAHAVARGYL